MTNTKIIYSELRGKGFTDNQLVQLIDAFRGDLPFHTFQEWKNRGYSVKKGEKAMFSTLLWRYTNKPNMAARKAALERGEEINEDPHFYKAKSAIFGFHQVKPLNQKPASLMLPGVCASPCTALAVI